MVSSVTGVALAVAVMVTLTVNVLGDKEPYLEEGDLRKALLDAYDKESRPSNPTKIYIKEITVLGVTMHEEASIVELYTWFHMNWTDPRLEWNPDEHGGVGQLAVDADDLWKPDLNMYTVADRKDNFMDSDLQAVLFPGGSVIFVPKVIFRLPCVADLTYWPHDSHTCTLKLGSWVHHAGQIDLDVQELGLEVLVKKDVGGSGRNLSASEWDVSNLQKVRESKTYDCCEEEYVSALIYLDVTRHAPAFCWTVKVPVVCLSLLTVVLFLLPPGAGEKLVFGGLCLILDVLFIAYTSSVVSHAPSHTPLIVQLVGQQMLLAVVSVVVAALVVRLARDPHPSPLPTLLKSPVITLSYFLCLSNYTRLVSEAEQGPSEVNRSKENEVELGEEGRGGGSRRDNTASVHKHQWILLAAVLDRLALFLYLVICVSTLSSFTSVL